MTPFAALMPVELTDPTPATPIETTRVSSRAASLTSPAEVNTLASSLMRVCVRASISLRASVAPKPRSSPMDRTPAIDHILLSDVAVSPIPPVLS